jgi:hypothetical protein
MYCLFEKYGITPKGKILIPVRDVNGVPQDKFLEVTEGGAIHKKLLELGGGKLPRYLKDTNNKEEDSSLNHPKG